MKPLHLAIFCAVQVLCTLLVCHQLNTLAASNAARAAKQDAALRAEITAAIMEARRQISEIEFAAKMQDALRDIQTTK